MKQSSIFVHIKNILILPFTVTVICRLPVAFGTVTVSCVPDAAVTVA